MEFSPPVPRLWCNVLLPSHPVYHQLKSGPFSALPWPQPLGYLQRREQASPHTAIKASPYSVPVMSTNQEQGVSSRHPHTEVQARLSLLRCLSSAAPPLLTARAAQSSEGSSSSARQLLDACKVPGCLNRVSFRRPQPPPARPYESCDLSLRASPGTCTPLYPSLVPAEISKHA